MIRHYFLFCALFWLPLLLPAQSAGQLKEEAKAFFAAEHYADALRTFQRSRGLTRSDEESRFLMAICHYQLNQLDEALNLLRALTEEERSPYPECWWYLGRIYHDRNQFGEAVDYYKLYLRSLRPEDDERAMVIEAIRRCDNGLRLWYRESGAVVENMGPNINSPGDEYGPVLSPSRATQLYFSAARTGTTGGPRDGYTRPDEQFGHYLSDMFTTRLQGGQWQRAEPLHYLLNSPRHDILLGFDGYGQAMIYFQGWSLDRGAIYVDTFQAPDERSLRTTPLLAPIQPSAGERQLFLFHDTLLIFAADRASGFGGLDLYRSSFRNGLWTTPENLGPYINSAYDETTPFLCRDGRTLYYSTNDSRRSVGGLDVVRNVYIPQAARWSEAENLGFPINSAADDSHFRLARDGFTGFLASARKDGLGRRDLYVVYFSKYRPEMEPAYASPPVARPASHTPSSFEPRPTPSSPENPDIPVAAPPGSPPPSSPEPRVNDIRPQPTTPERSAGWPILRGSPAGWAAQPPNDALCRQIRQWQQQHPAELLVVTAYLPGNPTTEELFAALQAAEAAVEPLARTGVATDRLFFRALAYAGPSPQLGFSVTTNPADTEGPPVIGLRHAPDADTAPPNLALCFKVQVASVQRAYQRPGLTGRRGLMLEHEAGFPYYRYTVGAAQTVADAQALRRELIGAGFDGAYLVPYLHGVRLDKEQARALRDSYPELGAYLAP